MIRFSILALLGSLMLSGGLGCSSADRQTASMVPEQTPVAGEPAQSEQTYPVAHLDSSYGSETASYQGTSIGRLPVPATARNPRLCTTG